MVVQHNLTAMNANRYFGINNSKLSKSLEKLSSGYAINRAGDNAAGLAVSEKMRSQIAGMTQGVKNAQDGISMIQTFEGALTETDSILQRMKTLADQAANGTYQDDVDREAIQLEFDQLNDELNQIADTDFNGVVLLNGGQMSDGTIAVGGKFDYTNVTAKAPRELTSQDVVIGDSAYAGTNDETVTFTATRKEDGTVTWQADSGAQKAPTNNAEGGFTYDGAVFAFDTDNVHTGDHITVDFTKKTAAVAAKAPAAIGFSNSNDKTVSTFGAATAGAGATPASENSRDLINSLNGAEINYTTDATGKLISATIKLKDGTTIQAIAGDGTDAAKGAATSKKPLSAYIEDGALTICRWDADAETPASADVVSIAAGNDIKSDAFSQSGTLTLAFSDAKYANEIAGGVEVKASDVSRSNSNNAATAPLTYTDHLVLQAGARTKDSVDFTFAYDSNGIGDLIANMDCSARADGLGTAGLKLTDQKSANAAIDKIDNAINKVSMVRGTFGAVQNRLEHKIDNMNVTIENLTSAESRIRDTNMAEEMMNFTKQQILSQASQSMLAQANQLPQSVLQLLQ